MTVSAIACGELRKIRIQKRPTEFVNRGTSNASSLGIAVESVWAAQSCVRRDGSLRFDSRTISQKDQIEIAVPSIEFVLGVVVPPHFHLRFSWRTSYISRHVSFDR